MLCLMICATAYWIIQIVPLASSDQAITPGVTILPVQTYTPTPTLDVSILNATPSATPQSIAGLQVGQYVKVTGTGGAGLRIRKEPGLGSEVSFLGLDDELFLVQDGPVKIDNYVWWFITAPYDQERSGWAASDFLLPIQ